MSERTKDEEEAVVPASTDTDGPSGKESTDGSELNNGCLPDSIRPEKVGAGGVDWLNRGGPPEPLVGKHRTWLAIPDLTKDHLNSLRHDAKDIGNWKLGVFVADMSAVECKMCGMLQSQVQFDEESGEWTNMPHVCESCEREGPFGHVLTEPTPASVKWTYDVMDYATDVAAASSGAWKEVGLPRPECMDSLWDDVYEFIETNWYTEQEHYYDMLTAWTISTWLRPEMSSLAHIYMSGQTMGGKTELIRTLSRVGFRCPPGGVGSTTDASVYRHIDKLGTTYMVTEFDDLNHDAQTQVQAVVKTGQKRDEMIHRASGGGEGNYDVEAFNPFTHFVVASKGDVMDDVKNRCLQIHTHASPEAMPRFFDEEQAKDIRERLLALRFAVLGSDAWNEAERKADEYCLDRGIKGRTREKLVSILAPAFLLDRLDVMDDVVEQIHEDDERAKQQSKDATTIKAVRALLISEYPHDPDTTTREEKAEWVEDTTFYSAEVDRIFASVTEYDENPQKTAERIRNIDRLETARNYKGSHIDVGSGPDCALDGDLFLTVMERECEHYGFELWADEDAADVIVEMNDVKVGHKCPLCGERSDLTHHHVVDDNMMCTECYAEIAEDAVTEDE